jgi:iron donor protein CyaY
MTPESEFISIANKFLQDLVLDLEKKDYDNLLEIDFQDEVLSIESPCGVFIINCNTHLRQIWLSSPLSGPSHFNYVNSRWVDRNNIDLLELIHSEITLATKPN